MARLSFLVALCEFKDQLIKRGHFHLKGRVRGDFSPGWQCAEVLPVNAKAARHKTDLGIEGKQKVRSVNNNNFKNKIKVHAMRFWW